MSRLTAAQVVKLGEYLNPDFDPNTLTVNQLLGIFGFHNVQYPTPYTKPKLVALFKDEITAKSNKLNRERVKRANSVASDDGITNGHTGRPLNDKPTPAPRRTSRRLSKTPAESTDEETVAPEQEAPKPKRRRPSAQPRIPAPSIPIPLPTPPTPIVEESEPEDSPARKVVRRGRFSNFAEDSGWEDNNIFQSGAEDSSPARAPSKPRAARKSATTAKAPRKSRKASSAPPEMASESDYLSPSPRSPARFPEASFEPQLSPAVTRETAAYVRANSATPVSPARSPPVFSVPSVVFEEDEPVSSPPSQAYAEAGFHPSASSSSAARLNEQEEEEAAGDSEDEQDEDTPGDDDQLGREAAHARAVSKTIADGGKSLVRRVPTSPSRPWYLTLLYSLTACFMLSLGYEYKRDSTHIGFCDTGRKTNDIIEQRKGEMAAIEECNRMNRTFLYDTGQEQTAGSVSSARKCPPPLIIPQLHPMTCTACPAHASCSRFTVACDKGYILRPHILLSFLPPPPPTSPSSDAQDPASTVSEFVWTGISKTFDGLPGLGPIAFPPRCVVDSKRTNRISALGHAIDLLLAQERGRRLCSGEFDNVKIPESEGGEAKKWGFNVKKLNSEMRKKAPAKLQPTFDSLFAEAIQGLGNVGGVIIGQDTTGNIYVAREIGDMSWNCALTVKTRDTWRAWRTNVLYSSLGLLAAFLINQRRTARRIEHKRVGQLAQVALDTLRNQELLYFTDPARTAAPYLPVDQLRDLVLQDEPSVKARAALWSRVGAVVEANANVRANLEETATGDEMRVWRWLGTPGRISG